MLAVVTVWVAIASPSSWAPLRGHVGAATVYVSNWWLAFQHVLYLAPSARPPPWPPLSLAVEEQFYLHLAVAALVWPDLVGPQATTGPARRAAAAAAASEDSRAYLNRQAGSFQATTAGMGGSDADAFSSASSAVQAGTTLVTHRPPAEAGAGRPGVRFVRREMWPLAGATVILAILSAIEMGVLYHPSFDPSRTTTDGHESVRPPVRCRVAMVWPSRGLRADVSPAARRFIDGMGALGLLAIGLLIWRTNEYSAFLYRGGMVLLSWPPASWWRRWPTRGAASAGSWAGPAPLDRGAVHGIYLWHYPVIVLTTATVVAGTDLTRDFFQVAATVIIADLSWRFIETPVRKGALGRLYRKMRSLNWKLRGASQVNRIALACVPVGLLVLTLCFAGVMPSALSGVLAVASAPPLLNWSRRRRTSWGRRSANTAHGPPTSAVTTPAHSTGGHSTGGHSTGGGRGAAVGPSKHSGTTSAPTDVPSTTAAGHTACTLAARLAARLAGKQPAQAGTAQARSAAAAPKSPISATRPPRASSRPPTCLTLLSGWELNTPGSACPGH